jgi:hypothetical protein
MRLQLLRASVSGQVKLQAEQGVGGTALRCNTFSNLHSAHMKAAKRAAGDKWAVMSGIRIINFRGTTRLNSKSSRCI